MFKTHFTPLILGSALLASSFVSIAQDHVINLHDAWNNLLSENVLPINNGHSTEVNYAAMKVQQAKLTAYVNALSAVTQHEFEGFDKAKQLAFLINAYNAWTVKFILTKYPDLNSIKDLGSFFSSPWSKEFVPLLGKTRSLDNIEHELIRGAVDSEGKAVYNDPRIHFAVNCASIGCPALREEAYTADKLEAQLQAQTIRFLSDNSRNFVEKNTLNVSSIFKWYGKDFEKGFRGANSLGEFIMLYPNALKLLPEQQNSLKNNNMDIEFLNYNWQLNGIQ